MPKRPTRRRNGTGSITWLGPSKALLRISTPDGVRSKTVRVAHRDHGGRGEADEALAAFDLTLEAERRPAAVTHSLSDTFDEYISDVRRRKKRGGTTTSYAQIKARLTPELAAADIAAITPRDLGRFYGELSERYADSTVATTHQVIKTVLKAAIEWRWLTTTNPAEAVKVATPSSPKRRKLSPTDVWTLILNAQTQREAGGKGDWVLATAITLAAFTGARRAELSGLRWTDLNEEDGSIAIVRQWAVDHDGQMGVQDLKSETGTDDEGRRVIYTPLVVNALQRFRAHQRAEFGREPTGWLLSHDGGTTPIKPQNLGAQITDHCRDLGFDGATPHSFRRLTQSELVAAGVDVVVAADRGGHTPQMMLGKYATARKDRAIAAGDALEERLIDQGLPIEDLFI